MHSGELIALEKGEMSRLLPKTWQLFADGVPHRVANVACTRQVTGGGFKRLVKGQPFDMPVEYEVIGAFGPMMSQLG